MYDPANPTQGLFRGFLLVRVYRLLIMGPGTTYSSSNKSTGRLPHGILNGLEKPMPTTIGYAAVMVSTYLQPWHQINNHCLQARWALSAAGRWGDEDFGFRLDDFFFSVITTLDPSMPDADVNISKVWLEETLCWWEV